MISFRQLAAPAALLTGACLLPSDPAARLLLEVELSTKVVWAPTGVDVTVRAANLTGSVITIPTGRGSCVLGYEMINAADSIVAQLGCFVTFQQLAGVDPADEVVVAAGDTLAETFSLSGFLRWVPGPYTVRGLLFSGENIRRTVPVAFELQCREPDWPRC